MANQQPSFRFGPQTCGSLDASAIREWLVTDGLGGYAMGTACGLRTRRYHGLLVVRGHVPGQRHVALAAVDLMLSLESGAQVRLSTHEWASGLVEPRGYEWLESFEVRDGLPCWRWRVGEIVIERVVAMPRHLAGVVVLDTLLAGGPVQLVAEPLGTWRDSHGERHATEELTVSVDSGGFVVADAYRVAGPGFESDAAWYQGVHHREEAARGLAASEDLYRPGRFVTTLREGQSLEVAAWALGAVQGPQAPLSPMPPAREVIEARRRHARAIAAAAPDSTTAALALAADAFVVTTPAGPDVVAGYPWFGSWSRDTMISYEGLFLATGRAAEGRALLLGYAATLSEGMLANTTDSGRPEHNTADATLWFLHAVDRHVASTGDTDLAAELIGALDAIVARHVESTRYGIRVDPADGLLAQGHPGSALTWMDAVVDGTPVTPRAGKAVELNALWINGLAGVAGLRRRLGQDSAELDTLRERAVRSFERRFAAPQGWLYDVVDSQTGDDPSLRPNQLLAFGLPHAPLHGDTHAAAVRAVARALLTPLGLRTLAAGEPGYRGRHRGDPAGRDRAYHQGTVWPWLLGPFDDAARAVGLSHPGLLDGVGAHLGEWGVGSVSETADGDPPHAATGCPMQAWSVAEVLRIWRRA
jgi:predicted glycogen debranching enzyme